MYMCTWAHVQTSAEQVTCASHPHAYLHAAVCEIRSSQPGLSSRNCWFASTHCTCVLCTASGQWNCIRRYFSNSLFWRLCMRSPGQNFPEQTLRWTTRLGTWQHGREQRECAGRRVACVCMHMSMVCQRWVLGCRITCCVHGSTTSKSLQETSSLGLPWRRSG